MLLWQNSYDPKKKSQSLRNKPKPFVPDFMKSKPTDKQKGAAKGTQAMPVDDIKSWLNAPRGV